MCVCVFLRWGGWQYSFYFPFPCLCFLPFCFYCSFPLPPLGSSVTDPVPKKKEALIYLCTPFHQRSRRGGLQWDAAPSSPFHICECPLCLVILLPNRSIIGALSLVNVASDTSDGPFVPAAWVRSKVGVWWWVGGWISEWVSHG